MDEDDDNSPKRTRLDEDSGISGSCDTCKRRKVRCDRTRPVCGWCAKNGVECVYSFKRKPGLKAGYGHDLVRRMELVEAELRSQRAEILLLKGTTQFSLEGDTDLERVYYSSAQPDTRVPAQGLPLSSDLPTGHGTEIASGTKTAAEYAQPSLDGLDNPFAPYNINDAVLDKLISLYFERVHPHFPVLDRQMVSSRSSMLLHAIVAISLKLLPEYLVSATDASSCHEMCKTKILLASYSITDLESLAAAAVLALDLLGSSNGPEVWGILPVVCFGAIYLGLNEEPVTDPNNIATKNVDVIAPARSNAEVQRRKRLFWGIYALDRYSAVSTSFPFRLRDSDISVSLPQVSPKLKLVLHLPSSDKYVAHIPEKYNGFDWVSGGDVFLFAYLMQILDILGSIHEFLRAPINIQSFTDVVDWRVKFRRLDTKLDEWIQNLPPGLADTSLLGKEAPIDPMHVTVLATYHTTVIRLHSSAGYSWLKSEFFTTSPIATQRCLRAVESVLTIAKLVASSNTQLCLGAHYAWVLWVSARLLLVDCVTNRRKDFPPDLEFLIGALNQLGKHWPVARRYAALLTQVIDEELELGKGDGTEHDSEMRSSAQILSDMRRNAYALDVLLTKNKEKRKADAQRTMFDFFNLPRQGGQMPLVPHSVDGLKDLLTRDLDVNSLLGEDWLK